MASTHQSSVIFQHSKISNFFSLSQKFEREKLFSDNSVKNQMKETKNFKFDLSIEPDACFFVNNKSLKSFSSLLSVRPKAMAEGEKEKRISFKVEEKSKNNIILIIITM